MSITVALPYDECSLSYRMMSVHYLTDDEFPLSYRIMSVPYLTVWWVSPILPYDECPLVEVGGDLQADPGVGGEDHVVHGQDGRVNPPDPGHLGQER